MLNRMLSSTKMKEEKSREKRVIGIVLILAVFCGAAMQASAAPNDKLTSCYLTDTSHPYAFFVGRSTSYECISQYPISSPPGPSTPITTSAWQNSPNQWFERVTFVANGSTGTAWGCYRDINLLLNARRTTSTPEVNVDRAIGNYRGDVEMVHTDGFSRFGVVPRGNVQTTMRYINQAGAMPSGGHYTYWNTVGTYFYQYDVGMGAFV